MIEFPSDYQIGVRRFSFKTLGKDPQNYRVCIFGDLGYFHGNSTASLIANGLAGKFDFIVHLGKIFNAFACEKSNTRDIAYDLHTNNGATGDNYMNQLEPLLSKVPYMVIAGNHEDDGKNFTDYQERFWMPHNGYGDNQFYSFDLGPVHWVGVSTEYYGYYYLYGQEPVMTQYAWLKNDLTTDAYKNPNAPVYVISGSAGCHSAYAEFSDTPWPFSAARSANWKVSFSQIINLAPSLRVNDYGYTILTIANSTHIHLEQISIEKGDSVVDEAWIVKDQLHTHSAALRFGFGYILSQVRQDIKAAILR
ncbi:hypothetical protein ANCCEY_09928 [Ancylostoma ceylanicum]|uniref:Calcineurin-like phosphoesterase domain-containing protein n=1 Tax=Ancylostoma ceylanicum TaxID=53326 RepID=A0A0D6LIG5_9BILA|nr:hypothetical protein ANCCEY_09928 [Ancylostoma ceylanicum]